MSELAPTSYAKDMLEAMKEAEGHVPEITVDGDAVRRRRRSTFSGLIPRALKALVFQLNSF